MMKEKMMSINNLFVLSGDEEETTPYEWDDMPEYVQENKDAYDEVTVRFRNQEDLEEFAKLIDQMNIIVKRKRKKSIWYPKLDRSENTLLRWVDEKDPNYV